MSRLFLFGMVSLVASALVAADFPEGTGAIEITEPGTYTASADRTFESLVVATPTGTADARTVTVFDHTEVPERTITVNGANPQFNVTNHYSDVWFKGGIWNFSGYFYLGNENSSTLGKDTFRRMYVTDDATFSGASRLYVNYGNGGNEVHVSNATVSVVNIYVQTGSAMTTDRAPASRGKLIVREGGKVRASGTLFVQDKYESGNSYQTGAAYVSGAGAEVKAKDIQLGYAPLTKAQVGSEMVVDRGGSVISTGIIKIGMVPYTKDPDLFDLFRVSDGTLQAGSLYSGCGDNVVNEQAVFSNSTVTATGDVISGYGANSATNSIVFRDCANVTLSDDLSVGYGEGSHDNFIGFYECGPIALTSTKSWYSGRGANSYGNTLLFSNTVVWTDREVAAGGNGTAHDNEVVVAGPQGRVIMALNQRDPVAAGCRNRFRITDDARLIVSNTSFYAFKSGYDSEIVVERGGQFFGTGKPDGTSSSFSITVARITSTAGLTSGNSLIARDGGTISCSGTLIVCGTNNTLVVDDGILSMGNSVTIGADQQIDSSSPICGADKCRLVVAGTHPKLDLSRNLMLKADANSILRFELSGSGYSWSDEPTRKAPIVLTGGSGNVLTVSDDTVLEADVSKLDSSARDTPIAVVSSKSAIVMSEAALANANAKGALAKKPYHFSLSGDKKTLFVTAESKGLMLMLK